MPFSAFQQGVCRPLLADSCPRASGRPGLSDARAVAFIVAVQGLVVVLTPRSWMRTTSVIMQTLLVCGLVLLLPLVLRLPAQRNCSTPSPRSSPDAAGVVSRPSGIHARRPRTYFVRLALLAVVGFAAVGICLPRAVTRLVYRRFDRVILRSERRGSADKADLPFLNRARFFKPNTRGARLHGEDASRSGLHQLVFLGIAVAGLAIAFNSALGARSAEARRQTALWMPFVLVFASVLGLRLALLLPLNRRAAWIFRLTEDDGRRSHELRVVEHVLITHAVLCRWRRGAVSVTALGTAPRCLSAIAVVMGLTRSSHSDDGIASHLPAATCPASGRSRTSSLY